MSDTLTMRTAGAAMSLDDEREWREGLAMTKALIERLETAHALVMEDLLEAKRRIEHLETALTAVVKTLRYGITTYPGPGINHRHSLCSTETACRLVGASKALDIDILNWVDEKED